MKKFLEYLERHTAVRFIIIISAFMGVIVAIPPLYHLFSITNSSNNGEFIDANPDNVKNYFIPTHKIKFVSNSLLVDVRNRPLTSPEIKELKYETADSKVIDASTIIGQINSQSQLRILKHDSLFLKIQYYDGSKVVVGYIPDTILLTLIKPLQNNPYGLGNSKIIIYTNNSTGIEKIYLDEKFIGGLYKHFQPNSNPSCEQTDGTLPVITKAGEHFIKAVDYKGTTWQSHITLYDGQCYLFNFSY